MMNKDELKRNIQSLALHFGEVVKCEWLDMDDDEWIPTEIEIDVFFFSEFEKDHIRNISYNKNGVELIMLERKRQISEEGWTAERDDAVNSNGELAQAAGCYTISGIYRYSIVHRIWPWDENWWKPTPDDRIKELTKAGALIAAEIDRLIRLKDKKQEE